MLPPALIADIAGGAYPAVMNILLALRRRDATGEGSRLDVAMADNVFTFMYWALANGWAAVRWPQGADELVTGGSPRYHIYRTRDDRFLAAAPIEDRFWATFCSLLRIDDALRDDAQNPAATRDAVAARVRELTAQELQALFAGHDVCCSLVATVEEAVRDPHFAARGLFRWSLEANGARIPALPMPVAPELRAPPDVAGYPALDEAHALLGRAGKEN